METEPALYIDRAPRMLARLVQSSGALCIESLRRHRALTALILAYALACYGAGWLSGGSAVIDIQLYADGFALMIAAFATVIVLGSIVRTMILVRPEGSLYEAIWRDLASRSVAPDRLANFLVPALLGPLFFSSFGSFKRLIPYVAPFTWDPTFANWDRWLHGGHDPWTLLQPVLGTPAVTGAVNAVYNIWFFVMFFTFIWQTMGVKRPALRMQFLTCFVLYWIVIGTGLAMLLSSAGPCYFGRVTGLPDPYAPLMAYLHQAAEHVPVWSLKVQEMLWDNYVGHGTMLGSGISAMPSMHLAIATLMALLGWRINRWVGIGYTAFAAVILVGSVHLGWHYAIDGYVSIVAAIAVWHATGWAMCRRPGVEARR
jgi:hypothetical protein